MSTQISLQALIDRAKSTLISKMGQNTPAIEAIACAIAGVSYGQYGYQDMLFRELHPETCSEDWLYLHASRHKTPRLLPIFAKGLVQFVQTGEVVVIPNGRRLVDEAQNEYESIKEQRSDAPVEVMALQSGTHSNLPEGSVLKLTQALSGVEPDNVRCLGISGGADIEALEHWRKRVVMAFEKSFSIGKVPDYISWAISAHADVDFAWVQDNTPERGMVQVFIGQRKNNPIVSGGVVNVVQEVFEENRLAGCHPQAAVPESMPLNVEIQGIEDSYTRNEVVIALENLIKSKMGKVIKVDSDTRVPEAITPTEITMAIAAVTNNFILRRPISEVEITKGQIHVLGEVEWTPPN
ncbi:baseplate J/gp47 family protein [Vibrio scophthalmi]|uniref:Uncharacterized protein n=1 Tax=Vibrio scophthalmi TaxID=45658 RepID=A0A1E3WJ23_9VIBR|nr:baseplate J/gp47 family protein [Vibrio scophthalmi]ODS09760.1 hypothetical protein VSF3289_03222 [Vibrio scophthalmi]